MRRVTGKELQQILPFFEAATTAATNALCLRAKCGSVIVKDGQIVGSGYNGPAKDDVSLRICNDIHDLSKKQKYDKTCCVHAEWRAIIDACKQAGTDVEGATLYFMRIDDDGNTTDAGEPYCTTCSRLTLESGISEFALWNNGGADIYEANEYNQKSYDFYSL